MLTVGLDVHQAATVACVLDDGGRTLETVTIRGGWERVVEWVGGLGGYNTVRPHSALGYRPPAPETIAAGPPSAPLQAAQLRRATVESLT